MIDWIVNGLVALGLVLAVAGIALVSVPAALVVLGVALIVLAVVIARVDEHRKRTNQG